MRNEIRLIPVVLLLSAAAAFGLAQATGTVSTAPAPPAVQHKPAIDDLTARGQFVFTQNCSRCHTAPESFSPRISGTVSKHMRVRANMSDADYKALLHFLNP